ncbi:OmpA family protein [Pseudoroseicyclus aestuarii]|uniref:Outer membrane protein OmpA-like peptidoglycan-associated protein n=1 Tax=Pseudoroseicyclus aestuarii TaxID=1795041 RepID=A0A318SWH1_9RHOB|nr:OmpA family protein [Pseudoroseicyclus aestuarii]PYE85852.1 outer membrane protein OmpA-like peptidoglycan-associated protein [Pseudoroseicyclus aestuarii]
MKTKTSFRTSTALVAGLSLMMPAAPLVSPAAAQEAEPVLCEDGSEPPCAVPDGATEEGTAPEPAPGAEGEAVEDAEANQAVTEAEPAPAAAETAEEAVEPAQEPAPEEAPAEAVPAEAAPADTAPAEPAATEPEATEPAAAPEAPAEAVEQPQPTEEQPAEEQPAEEQPAEAPAAEEPAEAPAEMSAPLPGAETPAEADAEAADAAAEAAEAMPEEAAPAEAEPAAPEAEVEAAPEAPAAPAEDAASVEPAVPAADAAPDEDAAERPAEDPAEQPAPQEPAAPTADQPEATEAGDAAVTDAEGQAQPDAAPQAAAAAAAAGGGEGDAEAPEVTETVVDEENSRQSDEEFDTAVDAEAQSAEEDDDEDDGLSNFQKALLLGAGAVAVGTLMRNGQQVVSNTGDRVVTQDDQGNYQVYRDDDALLRQPGSDIRTETFSDGSTRTTLAREDGSQVITIRDAEGRVLRRTRQFADGTQVQLFDDLIETQPVDVRQLVASEPQPVTVTDSDADIEALRAALDRGLLADAGRSFSLRQVRDIQEVRQLVPAIDLDTLTFASGSAAITTDQLQGLARLGNLMEGVIAENPREVFLVEGHTDATGSEQLNLALSDRRAETVALALTEAFAIPPENLVVQGYGESYLKVATQEAEPANRRATVRRITPLLQQAAAQ